MMDRPFMHPSVDADTPLRWCLQRTGSLPPRTQSGLAQPRSQQWLRLHQ